MYVYTYTDPFGKRRSLYAKDLLVLREKEEQLRKDQLDGLDVYVKGKATINFVFDRYINTKTELRETTYSNYIYTYDRYIRDGFGKKKIADIKFSDVLNFYIHVLEEYELSISTVENIHTVLHPTFNLAVRDDIIRNNPSDGVMAELKKKRMGKTSGVRHALTLEQQRAFLGYLNNEQYERWKPLFVVLFGTGCRIGEMIGLRWKDLDMNNRMITIDHSITYYPRRKGSYRCEYDVSLPKTNAGIRTIPMFDEVYNAFLEEKEMQKRLGICCTQEVKGMDGFVFCNRFGNLHNPASINRAIKRIREDYNAAELIKAKKQRREPILVPSFSCHVMRHTFCARLCERDTNLKVIQSVMGHADISTTMNIYAEVTDSKKKESFANIANEIHLF
jgi:integrase